MNLADKIFNWFLILVFILVVMTIFVLGMAIFTGIKESRGKEWANVCGISLNCKQCYLDCKRFGMKYIRYNPGGWGASSCWCMKKDNIPVRIW